MAQPLAAFSKAWCALEHAVDRPGADRQVLVTYLLFEPQMSIAFQRREENGQQWH